MTDGQWANLIAGVALFASLISIFLNWKSSRRQNDFDETAKKLNAILIEKEASDAKERSKAYLQARFEKREARSYNLIIFNNAIVPAKNIRIQILEGEDLFRPTELQNIFPIEKLDSYEQVKILVVPHLNSSRKAKLKLIWNDPSGDNNENIVTPHL